MNTQVQLFETPLSLLSIPLKAYPFCCQGIIRLVLGSWKDDIRKAYASKAAAAVVTSIQDKRSSLRSEDNSNLSNFDDVSSLPLDVEEKCEMLEDFINVSFTPLECSVICPTELIEYIFGYVIRDLDESFGIQVLKDQYVAIKIDSDGQDTGSSVLKMSLPLSSASIPIFFIATYFSDFVLVPLHERHRVIKTLESQSFVFSDVSNSYISLADSTTFPRSPQPQPDSPADDELAATLELRDQTLEAFNAHNVVPHVDTSVKLLLTGARAGVVGGKDSDEVFLSIVKILVSKPSYYSLTMSAGSEISFLIDHDTAASFPSHVLLGSPTDFVTPIAFDLRQFPQDTTGIVSGLASILTDTSNPDNTIHMRYLSTALAGVVLVSEDDLPRASAALPNQ